MAAAMLAKTENLQNSMCLVLDSQNCTRNGNVSCIMDCLWLDFSVFCFVLYWLKIHNVLRECNTKEHGVVYYLLYLSKALSVLKVI